MSWHISAALMNRYENSRSSLGLVAEFSEATCSDGRQSAPSSENPMPQAYLCKDRMTAFSRLSRFGMTFAPLTGNHGEDLLTWFLEDSRVKTSVRQEMEPALTVSAPACGEKWRESSVRYDLDSSSWKTHLCLWEEDLPWSSVILPKWGMARNGAVFQHPTLERPISVTASGLWPTPRSCSAMGAMITPESAWAENRFPNLETVVGRRLWPTQVSSMSKGSSPNALTRKSGKDRSNDRLDHAVMASDHGHLNPVFVEWLMGWPLGWTDLKPLEMARFVEWRRQHSQS